MSLLSEYAPGGQAISIEKKWPYVRLEESVREAKFPDPLMVNSYPPEPRESTSVVQALPFSSCL